MNSLNFANNPFALCTAQQAWQNENDSLIKRAYKATVGTVYDIYIKNPYDLTIGNCNTLINSTASFSIKTKISVIATVIFGTVYTFMLYGGTLHLGGRGLKALGDKSGLDFLARVGERVENLGTNIFLVGGVPTYGVCYALPKYIISSIPKVLNFVAEKISLLSYWIFQNTLQPLWNNIIVPVMEIAYDVLSFFATKLEAGLKAIGNLVNSVAKKLFEYVLTPFWKNVMFPILQTAGNILNYIATKVGAALLAIGQTVDDLARKLFEYVLCPLWENVMLPILQTAGNIFNFMATKMGEVLLAIGQTVDDLARKLFEYVISPLWEKAILPLLKTVIQAFDFTVRTAYQTMHVLVSATAKTANLIFQKLIHPLCKGLFDYLILPVGNLLLNYAVKPLIFGLVSIAEKVGYLFKAIFNGLIIPIAEGAASVFNAIKESVYHLNNEIWQTMITFREKFS